MRTDNNVNHLTHTKATKLTGERGSCQPRAVHAHTVLRKALNVSEKTAAWVDSECGGTLTAARQVGWDL